MPPRHAGPNCPYVHARLARTTLSLSLLHARVNRLPLNFRVDPAMQSLSIPDLPCIRVGPDVSLFFSLLFPGLTRVYLLDSFFNCTGFYLLGFSFIVNFYSPNQCIVIFQLI